MRRLNVRDAFVGEPTGSEHGPEEAGEEAVVLTVRGGEIVAVVPEGTRDDQVLDAPLVLRGSLRLENERVLSFEIHDEATGAFIEHESIELHRRRQESGSVGLSSIGGLDATPASRLRADSVMATELVCTTPDVSVQEVSRLLAYHNVSGLPVVDSGGKLVGIVTEADVIGKRGSTAADIMTGSLVTATRDTPLEQVAHLMANHRVKRVLIVDGDRLVGLVSRADIVRALAGN
jgi:CBS domain-containing protein